MSALTPILREKIEAAGPISLAEYMALALCHPEHGYYMKRDPFGARGDFITAPEISQIFSEMIGVWCAQVWERLGGGPISLVELGPGRGTLMSDVLRATRHVAQFHESLSIHMVEMSPVLAHAQYQCLRDQHPRIEWLDHIGQLPHSKTIVIANEFFDALPIKQFVMTREGMRERRVGWDDTAQEFCFVLGEPGLSLAKSGSLIPENTVIEQASAGKPVMRQLAQHLKENGGAALIIDYGYLGEAHHDTLQAMKAHLFHPVLKDPGEADITSHVDFLGLMAVAREAGLSAPPLTDQGLFLTRMGAPVRLSMLLKNASAEQRETLSSGLERLTRPEAMGTLFKVLGICSDPRIPLPGFGE